MGPKPNPPQGRGKPGPPVAFRRPDCGRPPKPVRKPGAKPSQDGRTRIWPMAGRPCRVRRTGKGRGMRGGVPHYSLILSLSLFLGVVQRGQVGLSTSCRGPQSPSQIGPVLCLRSAQQLSFRMSSFLEISAMAGRIASRNLVRVGAFFSVAVRARVGDETILDSGAAVWYDGGRQHGAASRTHPVTGGPEAIWQST